MSTGLPRGVDVAGFVTGGGGGTFVPADTIVEKPISRVRSASPKRMVNVRWVDLFNMIESLG